MTTSVPEQKGDCRTFHAPSYEKQIRLNCSNHLVSRAIMMASMPKTLSNNGLLLQHVQCHTERFRFEPSVTSREVIAFKTKKIDGRVLYLNVKLQSNLSFQTKIQEKFIRRKPLEGNVPNSGRSPQGIAISFSTCFLRRAPSIPAGISFEQ
ncbi:hypothetical protein CEXT_360511 [Caerostris extrusa]|uniref:Uncharacterized protein n=1 Tax=Caerostris extrusa TaxID=172846 RepID=A0AAV4NHE2_CAEEX|nr:hypothetical protein CEXT_360511 [Caerostris extrusa]